MVSGPSFNPVLVGGNNVTLNQSLNGASATITISAANQSAWSNTFGMSNLGNTTGTTGVVSGTGLQMVIVGGNNITISQSTNLSSATLTISGLPVGTLQYWGRWTTTSGTRSRPTEMVRRRCWA
jgi:hypothetical protein